MDYPWEPLDNQHHRLRNRNHRHPSFSSSLLDQIYRSIDDSSPNSSSSSMRKTKHQNHRDETAARVSSSNRRATAADGFIRSRNLKKSLEQEPVFFKLSSTTSSSSDSSGGFSSSESDSFYRRSKSSPAIHSSSHHPKPIRTTVVERSPQNHRPNNNTKQEHGSFLKTKSKALKIYTDLKKVKQPISPGGRLATFLNSIFTGAGNTKKLNKINTTVNSSAAAASSTTTCSSASSFSRSCLSKTPSSSEKSKRSVRFCPVNVIFDEDSSNSKYNNNEREYDESTRHHHHHRNFDTLEIRVIEENRRVIEAAKELLRTYQKSNKDVVKISGDVEEDEEDEEDEDDDDALSCTSSDLFELDNLSAIGIDRYREELPVYETTRLNTNRIISR